VASYDPERSFGFLLHDISRLMRKRFERRARTIGLTRAQWSVLANVARKEGINQTALAEILEIEPITLVRQIDRLEAAGWIERRLDPTDRRVRLLYLTESAQPILERMRELGAATRAETLASLTPSQQEALIDTLIGIKATLSSLEAATQAEENPANGNGDPAPRARRRNR
jgi:MarR family transcriptional regulator, transcriptional regulator for hemolysin